MAYDLTTPGLTILALVSASPQHAVYDLSRLGALPQQATVTLTSFDSKSLLRSWQVPITGSQLALDVGAAGVYSLVLPGVRAPGL